MKKMKAGIIGCGNISGIYFTNLKNSPWVEIVACADLIIENAKTKADEFNIPNVYTVEEMLAQTDIEFIINLTIPSSHANVDIASLEAGKHVYSEKPLAITLDEGRRVLNLADQKGLRVGCAPDTFLGSGVQTAKAAIESGLIGRPIAATAFMMGSGPEAWHPNPEFFYASGGGPMMDMGPYYVSALVELLGPASRISASTGIQIPDRVVGSGPLEGKPITVQTPTHLAGTMDFENGAIATMITSFDIFGGSGLPWLEIYGTQGSLSLGDPNFFNGEVKLRKPGSEEWGLLDPVFECGKNERGLGIDDMIQSIHEQKDHRVSARLAYHVLEIMQSFQQSSLEGRHIVLQSTYRFGRLPSPQQAESAE
ncbi:gfo/Idh/MocA family oxidoreductase [Paenibacillus glucanolyticus]|jgi:predicted dehydrogenase|uniref:Gfo/Idh/MocA family protein n=1 Tax=Paenibacillus TaxID=44249 RepID=UPI0003E1C87E|nr:MULTISPECIES: Gfo/Idh/MocA family oxidoreductase [Paenibacillus]ANA81903.1 oxidoreductase [Paenibacillus glucanolyticus]AVV59364.1 gfo/Idh/MocA family oxidoreductase [Paenibacillus glucanolyticus]ETT43328.1 oxidoreductase domain-containing protein [Paenibacillus sp. FSL R5-808]